MNCWYTIDTRRFCTGTPVTSRPPNHTSPPVGFTRPAIRRSSVVLPASVSPSKVLKPRSASVRLVGWMWTSAPTRSETSFSSRVTSQGRDERGGRADIVARARPGHQEENCLRLCGPALDDLFVRHRHALGLLVGQLRLRTIGLAKPFLRIDRLVQARPAA